ncbi:MAG: hypothetical protein JST79_06700 [Acidobacteria bacterium]|nr:hypothetical protein [Acidobacteriota bacterium]
MLLLENGEQLRLLDGLTSTDLQYVNAYLLESTPTRFGRITLQVEPLDRA